jgi:hypothetical protein
MSWTVATPLAIVGAAVALAFYDLLAYRRGGNDATISVAMLRAGRRYPMFAIVVAFIVGVLFGHLFLPQHVQP